MRTKTKHVFSVWFLLAGVSMLLVALWQVFPPILNHLYEGDGIYHILGTLLSTIYTLVDVGNILLGILAFGILAIILILFAFRRVRWLLILPPILLLWQSVTSLLLYVVELFAWNDFYLQLWNVSYFEMLTPLSWINFLVTILLPMIAYFALTLIAVLYTIPKTRVVARVLGHVPAILFTGFFICSCFATLWDIVIGGYLLLSRLPDITPLPLVMGLWLLWIGILRERQVVVPIYEGAPVTEPTVTEKPAESPVCTADAPASEEKKRADISEQDAAEAIRLYKKLLDEGAITAEEFNAKKKQLLNVR